MAREKLVDRIEINPQILGGKPVIAGTRISVGLVLDFLAHNWSPQKLLVEYPTLCQEDIQAAIAYASQRVTREEIHLVPLSKESQRVQVRVWNFLPKPAAIARRENRIIIITYDQDFLDDHRNPVPKIVIRMLYPDLDVTWERLRQVLNKYPVYKAVVTVFLDRDEVWVFGG